MSIINQELVDYLNSAQLHDRVSWLEAYPQLVNFVTCPFIHARPSIMPDARQISCSETRHGRFVHIRNFNDRQLYIHELDNKKFTLEKLERLKQQVESFDGSCHVERSFLVINLPGDVIWHGLS